MSKQQLKGEVGHAFVFDNAVVFGGISDLITVTRGRGRRKFGEFLGAVKGVVPVDPYRVLYTYLKDTPAFRRRQAERRLRRRLKIKRTELRKIRSIAEWIK